MIKSLTAATSTPYPRHPAVQPPRSGDVRSRLNTTARPARTPIVTVTSPHANALVLYRAIAAAMIRSSAKATAYGAHDLGRLFCRLSSLRNASRLRSVGAGTVALHASAYWWRDA